MWLRRARALSGAGCLALVLAAPVAADPDAVKCWTWGPAEGDVESDPRFVQRIEISMVDYDEYMQPFAKTGYDAGVEAAEKVLYRQNHGLTDAADVWIFFKKFGWGRSPWTELAGDDVHGQPLFFAAADDLATGSPDPIHVEVKPWLKNGVQGMANWIDWFIVGYRATQDYYADPMHCGTCGVSILDPSRFHFDNEIQFIVGPGFTTPTTVTSEWELIYAFEWMMSDPRWDDDDELYGFPGQSLKDLFDNAGVDFETDHDAHEPENRAFSTWYTYVCNTVRNYAMYEAAYKPLYEEFEAPGSDYEATVLADGAGPDHTFGRDRFYYDPCASSSNWKKSIIDGPHANGELTPFQAPVLYSIDNDFWTGGIFTPAWGTDQFSANMQYYRDLLNTCMRSYLHTPSTLAPHRVTPWVTIPDHSYITLGSGCSPSFSYTEPQLRQLLALCSARIIEEMIVWTDPRDTTDIALKWEAFQRALNWAYYADVTGYNVTAGTGSTSWSNPISYANADPLEIEAEEDGEEYKAEVEIDFVVADAPDLEQFMTVNAEAWLACTSCPGLSTFEIELWGWDLLAFPDPDWVLMGSAAIGLSRDLDDPIVLAIDHISVENYVDENQTATLKVVFTSNGYPFDAFLDMVQLVRTDEPTPNP